MRKREPEREVMLANGVNLPPGARSSGGLARCYISTMNVALHSPGAHDVPRAILDTVGGSA